MVELSDKFDDVGGKLLHFELVGQQVELEKGTNVFLRLWRADRPGVEPAHQQLERIVVFLGQAIRFVASFLLFLVLVIGVEDGCKEGRIIAEESFVNGPVSGVGADVDIYER